MALMWNLGLFTFNPFGVVAPRLSPQVSPGAIHIQPLRGWRIYNAFTPGGTSMPLS